MHLIIAGRTDLPLPLSRLRARNQVNEIRAADLRFTSEETAVFFNQCMGLRLSTESVASLETFTEGWIAGLQLAGLALQGQDPQPDACRVSMFIQAYSGRHGHIVN